MPGLKNHFKFKSVVESASFAMLLLGSFYFGCVGSPAEMSLIIVASALGIAFSNIDRIREIKGVGFEAKLIDAIGPIIAKETEMPTEGGLKVTFTPSIYLARTDADILKSLGNSKYTWRTITGVVKDTNYPVSTIRDGLTNLTKLGLAVQSETGTHSSWALTGRGRETFTGITTNIHDNTNN